jgi:hypothetical protein
MNYTQLTAAICDYTQNFDTDFVDNIPVFVKQAEQRIYNTVQFPPLRKNVTGASSANVKYLSCPEDFLAVYSMATFSDATTSATKVTEFTMQVVSPTGIIRGQNVTGTNIFSGTTVVSVVSDIVTVSQSLSAFTTGSLTFQGDYEYLLNKDVNFIRQAYPNPGATGAPKYYALFGPTSSGVTITDELTFLLGPTPDAPYKVELHYYYYPASIVTAGTSWLGDNFDTVLLYGSLVEAITFMKGETDMVALYDGKYKEALGMAKRLGDGLERSDSYRSGQYRMAPLPQNNGVV